MLPVYMAARTIGDSWPGVWGSNSGGRASAMLATWMRIDAVRPQMRRAWHRLKLGGDPADHGRHQQPVLADELRK